MFERIHLSHDAEELSRDEAAERTEAEDSIRGKMPEASPSPAAPALFPSLESHSSAAAERSLFPPIPRSGAAGRPLNEAPVWSLSAKCF